MTDLEIAERRKAEGNVFYRDGKLVDALNSYNEGLRCAKLAGLSHDHPTLMLQLLSNRVQVHLRQRTINTADHLELQQFAVQPATQSKVDMDQLAKALYRCARCYLACQNYKDAMLFLRGCHRYGQYAEVEQLQRVISVDILRMVADTGAIEMEPAQKFGFPFCAICQEVAKEGDDCVRLRCRHAFHVQCELSWLFEEKAGCQVCKADVFGR